jgi:hypothetical protein
MGRAPAHLLSNKDSAHLAPGDPDSPLVRGLNQRVEGPMAFGFRVGGDKGPLGLAHDRTGRRALGQRDDLAALRFGQARFTPRAQPIPETLEPFCIEAHNPLAHGLRMAAQFVGDRRGSPSVPTVDNHPRPEDPIAGRVPALGEPTNLAFFRVIAGSPGTKEFRHRRLLIILDDALILYLY